MLNYPFCLSRGRTDAAQVETARGDKNAGAREAAPVQRSIFMFFSKQRQHRREKGGC